MGCGCGKKTKRVKKSQPSKLLQSGKIKSVYDQKNSTKRGLHKYGK
jgi:hypothetical protein|tara:strand:+ start:2566 stop:2703 length:138 start_codon:yes stop_codon:yes gene_type:complete